MDPHQNFMKWGEMARKFLGNDFWGDMLETMPSSGPKADVYHGHDEVLVLIDLPGVEDISQIQLQVEEDTLLVKGRVNPRHTHYQANLQERFYGDFERRISWGPLSSEKIAVHATGKGYWKYVYYEPVWKRISTPFGIRD